jgi:hypothetical protein
MATYQGKLTISADTRLVAYSRCRGNESRIGFSEGVQSVGFAVHAGPDTGPQKQITVQKKSAGSSSSDLGVQKELKRQLRSCSEIEYIERSLRGRILASLAFGWTRKMSQYSRSQRIAT